MISANRLSEMEAHVDAGGQLKCDQELLSEIGRLRTILRHIQVDAESYAEGTGQPEFMHFLDLAASARTAFIPSDSDREYQKYVLDTLAVCKLPMLFEEWEQQRTKG